MYNFAPILQRIKSAKAAASLTNEELAQKSGVPFSTLNKILSGGTTEPKLPAIMAIASALNVSTDYLIYGEQRTADLSLSPDELRLLSAYRALNQQGKEYILQTLDMAAKVYIKPDSVSNLEKYTG